jgi:hypothetical protein
LEDLTWTTFPERAACMLTTIVETSASIALA